MPKKRSTLRKPGLPILLVLTILIGTFWLTTENNVRLKSPIPVKSQQQKINKPPDIVTDYPLEKPKTTIIAGNIGKGEAFSEALKREQLSHSQVYELVSAVRKGVRPGFNPNIVQRGDRYLLEVDNLGILQRFEYTKQGALETKILAERQKGILKAWKEQTPLSRQITVVSGKLKLGESLWHALNLTRENPDILSAKMIDIFESEIDFMVDCRRNDSFSFVVEKLSKDGELVRYGDILAAEYRALKKTFRAFLYEDLNGTIGYYNAEGKSLQGLFLKSPLNYRRISSRFNPKRFHPILKKIIPHHGIDYAADYGTHVWATANGVVTFIGRRGALGNYIEVRHKNGYKTGYGHLSRFRKGLRKGSRIKQKQTIGYVGATGRATGPHLHYNFFTLRGSIFKPANPARMRNRPTGKPVSKTHMAHFQKHQDRLSALLDQKPIPVVTASLTDARTLKITSPNTESSPNLE